MCEGCATAHPIFCDLWSLNCLKIVKNFSLGTVKSKQEKFSAENSSSDFVVVDPFIFAFVINYTIVTRPPGLLL